MLRSTASEVMWVGRAKVLAFGMATVVAVLLFGLLMAASPAQAVTFTVNSTADTQDANLSNTVCDVNASAKGNQCTLRAAIQEANNTSGADVISFNIPDNPNIAGFEVKTISPTRALPTITQAVTINGYTQPGASLNTLATSNNAVLKVQLNGTNAGGVNGLLITSSNSTIKGLVINRFKRSRNDADGITGNGILIDVSGATGNRVQGNFIGTNAAGTGDLGNEIDGVRVISASNNTVGGTAAGARNVISGNNNQGVFIINSGATGNRVQGNFIGTGKNGTADLGNAFEGVAIFGAPNNTIGGTVAGARNIISGNGGHGVEINSSGATGNKVEGNRIGTGVGGGGALGNSLSGVEISGAPNNTVGGTVAGARNIISGNDDEGVSIIGTGSTGNKVEGNFIGTNAAGSADLGNGGEGVEVFDASDNTVGGAQAAARNVISGNTDDGVEFQGDTLGNEVLGNFIGTNAAGSADLGNGDDGVHILGEGNTVGGTAAGTRNVISGNGGDGVDFQGVATKDNKIEGNFIGTRASSTQALGNGEAGVNIRDGAFDNTIGGTTRTAGNRIAHNGGAGVSVATSSTGNRVLSNQIFSNTGLGIDLGTSGVTPNDTDDPDTGANNLQNFPVVTSVIQSSSFLNPTRISGTLSSTPSQEFTIQCFVAPSEEADPSGHGEGQGFMAEDTTVTTDPNGNATFECNFLFPQPLEGKEWSATATNEVTGDTSEFSANFTVSSGP